MEGRWCGDYEGGVSPRTWTGSLRILEQFLRSGGGTVKYGQCWVFSGLLTTGGEGANAAVEGRMCIGRFIQSDYLSFNSTFHQIVSV